MIAKIAFLVCINVLTLSVFGFAALVYDWIVYDDSEDRGE